VNSFLGAASAASTGAVLALLPCFATELWPILERATESNALTNEVWLLVHADVLRTARVRAVVDHLVAELGAAKDILHGAPRAPACPESRT
jgi:DNA-binding transcriptional LysR family regulator